MSILWLQTVVPPLSGQKNVELLPRSCVKLQFTPMFVQAHPVHTVKTLKEFDVKVSSVFLCENQMINAVRNTKFYKSKSAD